MNCREAERSLDDFLDLQIAGRPSSAEDGAFEGLEAHIEQCARCADELKRRRRLLDALRALPAPRPSAGFFEKAVATAVQTASEKANDTTPVDFHRRRTDLPPKPSYATALQSLAAAVVVALLLGSLWMAGHDVTAPETGLPAIELIRGAVTPIKLAFSSETALTDARLSLSLPVGVELVGYQGRTDISWNTDLAVGTNVLRLPLVGRLPGDHGDADLLVAKIEHASGAKIFQLHVTVTEHGADE